MNARELTARLGGKWHGSYGVCACPAHSDRTPSMTVRDGDSTALLTCHAGCERSTIIRALRQMGLWQGSDRRRHKPVKAAPTYPGPAAPKPEALAIWNTTQPAPYTLVQRYLAARGLNEPIPPILRYTPEADFDYRGDQRLPAMVAGIQSSVGDVVAVHRTFLDDLGHGKANVSPARKMLGQLGDGAIRLAPAEDELGLAEGIETALSIMALGGPPTWAAMSCNRLASVAVPASVRTVHIFRDSGLPGLQGAQKAVERHTAAGRRVLVHSPPDGFGDFNDVLTGDRAEEVA